MSDKENLAGNPDSRSNTSAASPEIPVVPPDVVAFGQPESSDESKDDTEESGAAR